MHDCLWPHISSPIFGFFGQLDLFILQWEEVLCDGFDHAVFFPSDRRGKRHVLIIAIKDNKMGAIPT